LKSDGVPAVHIDVMDGHFVPNCLRAPVIAGLADGKKRIRFPFSMPPEDERPGRYLDDFVKAARRDHLQIEEVTRPHRAELGRNPCAGAAGLNGLTRRPALGI